MKIRRVVTGLDREGKSRITSDSASERSFNSLPGFQNVLLWSEDSTPTVGQTFSLPNLTVDSYIPSPGGNRLMVVTLPPDESMANTAFDPVKYIQEIQEKTPGFESVFEPDVPGMHTTPTLDYGVVLAGEVILEVDGGEQVTLRERDVIVQNGVRHAWRNRSGAPVTLLFVLLGAQRRDGLW